jgi:hypothetical protein
MTGIDAIKQAYPEAALLVDPAHNVWNGYSPTAKIEIAISDKLKAEFLNLTGKDIQAVFITDSGARHMAEHTGEDNGTTRRFCLPRKLAEQFIWQRLGEGHSRWRYGFFGKCANRVPRADRFRSS